MIIMGHRGARGEAPENTIKAIQYALELGAKAIEIDIHKTKDNQLVVIHDDTLERTTSGQGKILEHNLSELKELDAGEGERIPTLKEVLLLIHKFQAQLQIEMKADDLEEQMICEIKKQKAMDLCTAISFNHQYLFNTKQLEPNLKTAALLYGLPMNPVQIAEACQADGLSFSISTIDQIRAKEIKDAGLNLTVWNIETKEEFDFFERMGADFAGTDYPSRFLK